MFWDRRSDAQCMRKLGQDVIGASKARDAEHPAHSNVFDAHLLNIAAHYNLPHLAMVGVTGPSIHDPCQMCLQFGMTCAQDNVNISFMTVGRTGRNQVRQHTQAPVADP